MTDKLCKDCVHNREGAHYDYCNVEFIKSTCGLKISNKFASCDARYNNCLCGAEGKHFEAKVEYECLDKIWKKWEKEGVTQEEFEAVFKHLGECRKANGFWATLEGSANQWAFACSYSYYRIPKGQVPDMPAIVIPDCPHCGNHGSLFHIGDKCYWWCDRKEICLCAPLGKTPREAITLFHKLIKEK